MVVGFTSTSLGCTAAQLEALRSALASLGCKVLHHGDRVGADAQAHEAARAMGARRVAPVGLRLEAGVPRDPAGRDRPRGAAVPRQEPRHRQGDGAARRVSAERGRRDRWRPRFERVAATPSQRGGHYSLDRATAAWDCPSAPVPRSAADAVAEPDGEADERSESERRSGHGMARARCSGSGRRRYAARTTRASSCAQRRWQIKKGIADAGEIVGEPARKVQGMSQGMTWPSHFPPGCPPLDATALDGELFYLAHQPLEANDYKSAQENDFHKHADPHNRAGLSCWTTPEIPEDIRNMPLHKRKVVLRATFTPDEGKLKPTGKHAALGHRSTWFCAVVHADLPRRFVP